ncbi:unnamed protein product [Linum trigynum]|uniref:CCHC-type domain-containing protein n=1 Tax=Linum trigynum TaxID=586398 RepID=A0AAV2EFI7_9ROSI
MLEGIRGYVMVRVVVKYKMLLDSTDVLCPRIRKRVEKEKALARLCTARQNLNDKCEVKMGGAGYIVDLEDKSCTCGWWTLSDIPYCHAVSAISHLRKEVDSYVHPTYLVRNAKYAYKYGIPCLDGRQAWPDAVGYPVHPPKQRSMPGRPKKNRRKSAHEVEVRPQRNGVGEEVVRRGSVIHCKKCGGEGHNARTCTAPTAAPTAAAANNNGGGGRGKRPRTAAPNLGNTEPTARKTRVGHCSKCGSTTHNARTCPLNRGVGIQAVQINVGDRRTIEREMRAATRGVGVYVSEETGNQYAILNGSRGRAVGGTQHDEVQLRGSQPPPTQP